ncbi:MAG TPA: mercuric reductase [Candidatus Acidoferrum sp.]|jgi:pyruvate/2-oxoglutarate dehydrogenase complex dihydrolipoamide dehydrogenase (E3) component
MPDVEKYRAIVIGSGQGGTPLSQALAKAGWQTALVEREHVGGTCINEGCTPTKTMVASGRVAYLARRGADYGVHTGAVKIDMKRVRKRKRDIVNLFRGGQQKGVEGTKNLDLIFGEAAFTSAKSIEVTDKKGKKRTLSADYFFVNAGCRPTAPAIDGLADVPYLDSTSIMELAEVPKHLLVVGGGYIGLEFGQLFRRLGAEVTIVGSGGQLLGHEDKDVAEEVAKILKQDGIKILFDVTDERVKRVGKQIVMTARVGKSSRTIKASHLLVATGRKPNTDSLRPAAAGIALDERGFIKANDRLETNVANIFAIGDIKGGPAFTHISYDDFRILRTNLLEKGGASIAGRLVPYTVFIDPQLGRVGMTETEARATGRKIRVAKMQMTSVARALEIDESRGFMKAIVDAESGQILGAAVLGIEGGEVVSQIQIAMWGKLPFTVLRDGVFAHPTLSEALNNLFTSHFQD